MVPRAASSTQGLEVIETRYLESSPYQPVIVSFLLYSGLYEILGFFFIKNPIKAEG